jgi:hypothetical protein
MKKGTIEFTQSDYGITVPINFQRTRQMAEDLVYIEHYSAFLEKNFLKLISLFSAPTEDSLPPQYFPMVNTDCSYLKWSLPKVKDDLKNIIETNLYFLKIKGTDYTPIKGKDEFEEGVLRGMEMNFFPTTNPGMEIYFSHDPAWQFDLDIKPRQGDIIRPSKTETHSIPYIPTGKLCVFSYQGKYTLKLPVLVTIIETNSFDINPSSKTITNEKGYVMHIPMMTVIYGNQPRVFVPNPYRQIVQQMNEVYSGRANISSLNTPETEVIRQFAATMGVETITWPYNCDNPKRTGNVTVIVSDGKTPIADSDITFNCNNTECFIGTTDSQGKMVGSLPVCNNGLIIASKTGYNEGLRAISTTEASTQSYSFMLEQLKEYKVNVMVANAMDIIVNYNKTKSVVMPNPKELKDATVQITLESANNYFGIIYPDKELLTLGPGEYGVSLHYSEKFDDKSEDIPASSSMQYIWTPTDTQLQNTDIITFYVLRDEDNIVKEDGTLQYQGITVPNNKLLELMLPKLQ